MVGLNVIRKVKIHFVAAANVYPVAFKKFCDYNDLIDVKKRHLFDPLVNIHLFICDSISLDLAYESL